MYLLTDKPFDDLFRRCTGDAFHLEVRDSYGVPQESEPFQRFLDGEPEPDYGERPWVAFMRSVAERGVKVSRVRVVTVPHSDYQRWLFGVTRSNVEAGEDIRYLPRHLAGEVPSDDWWLFDTETVAFNLIDRDGKPAGAGITEDPRIVEYCNEVRRRLWGLATPYQEYISRSDESVRL
ncbi:DUF6879 family protein [Nocardia thraciensis]